MTVKTVYPLKRNLKRTWVSPIEETEVDFNITRKLTAAELEQTIQYCKKYDVDATEILYNLRQIT